MGRRANGEGTILARRDEAGRILYWEGAVSVGLTTQGKIDRRWATGPTQAAVREKLEKIKTARDGNTLPSREKFTVADLLKRWIESVEGRNRASNTLSDYRQTARKLTEALGKKRVDKLSVKDVEEGIGAVCEKYGAKAGVRCLTRLRQALNQAMRWEVIGRNVAQLAQMPTAEKPKVDFWQGSEPARFLEHARSSRLYGVFYLALTLGLRSGELRGLRWADVDLERGWLHVQQQAQEDERGAMVFKSTLKTDGSNRRIRLDRGVVEVLRAHRVRQDAERYALENPHAQLEKRRDRKGIVREWQDLDLVCAANVGTAINDSNFRREFDRLTREAGVKRIRIHDMRHTAATAMIRHGMGVKLVADILGHADIKTTLNRYAHIWDEQRESEAPSASAMYGHGAARGDEATGEGTERVEPEPGGIRLEDALNVSAKNLVN